jgi:MinD-like ATPase involved in chromosome partitioning or flagellar assembly
MTAVLDVTIRTTDTATVAGESVVKGRHKTIHDAAMDRCREIARARRERVAVRARAEDGREHWVWTHTDGKVSRMGDAEIRAAERSMRVPVQTRLPEIEYSRSSVDDDSDEAEPPIVKPSAPRPRVSSSVAIGFDSARVDGSPEDMTPAGASPFDIAPGGASPVGSFGVIGAPAPSAAAATANRRILPASEHAAAKVPAAGRVLPTFEDVLEEAEQPRDVATSGWRALLKLPPGRSERDRRADQDTIKRSDLDGPRTVVVVNVKGGVGKTTTTRHLAAAIGSTKGGYTIAIDANPSRGNLANRCKPADHKKTVIDLLDDIERFQRADARVGELATYVRPQDELFDVLSSDQDTERMQTLGLAEFTALDAVTDKFYRIKIIDTGNDFRHVAYQAALDVAHGLVIASEIAEDAFEGASWTVDALRDNGYAQLVDNGVAVLIRTSPRRLRSLEKRMLGYFAAHCREVVIAPYDPHQVGGKRILQTRLLPPTVRASEKAAAAVLRGLPATVR